MDNVLTIIFILHFLNDGIRTVFVSSLPFITKDLHLTFTQVGILGAAQGMLALFLAIPMGIITSKINGIKLLFLLLFAYSVCAIGIGFANNFFVLFFFFYVAAAAFAPFHIIGQSTTARESAKQNIGSNMGTFATIGDSGRVALPAVALFITTYIGWRNASYVTALGGLIILMTLVWLLRNKKHVLKNNKKTVLRESSKDWIKQMISMLKQKKLLLIMFGGLFDGIAGASIFIYLPFLLLEKGVMRSLLSFYVGGYFLGSLLGKKYLSKGVETYGSAQVFISAEILMAGLMIIATFSHNAIILFLISCILGLFTRGTTPVVATLFTTVSHEAHYEKVYAIGDIFLGSAAVISPILLGRVADSFGITAPFYLASFFAIAATIPIYLYNRST